MVEVFKTNVTSNHLARVLVDVIQDRFEGYKVNFDVDDCDHVLRVESTRMIEADPIMNLLRSMGIRVETLSDERDDLASVLSAIHDLREQK